MSASSEIRWKIGADTSAFSRSMVGLQSIAAAAGKQLHKKFGLQDAFKSSVLALGLSIEKIKDSIAELFTGGSQEAWKRSLESAAQATDLIIEKQLARLDTTRQIAVLEKEIARNKEEEDFTPRAATQLRGPLSLIQRFMGPQTLRANLRSQGESQAEANERANAARVRGLQLEKQVEDLRKRGADMDSRVAEAREKADMSQLSDEEKLLMMQQDYNNLSDELAQTAIRTDEVKEREIKLANDLKDITELQNKIEKDRTEELDRRNKKIEEGQRRQQAALEDVAKAQKSIEEARHDAVAFGINDAASGKRGTPSDRFRAKRILADEALAQRLFDSKNTITQFDNGQNVSRDFNFFQNRAEQMRKGFTRLKTDDQAPFDGVTKQLREANSKLQEIVDALEVEDIGD